MNSSVVISGCLGSFTQLTWPNSTLHTESSTTSFNSSIVITRLVVISVTNDDIVVVHPAVAGEVTVVISNVSVTQMNSSESHRYFILLPPSSSNVSALTLVITHCTFVTPWGGHTPLILIMGLDVASIGANTSVILMLDQVFLSGFTSLIDAPSVVTAPGLLFVSSIALRCSWWGRHPFTSPLSPVHLAHAVSCSEGLSVLLEQAPTCKQAPTVSIPLNLRSARCLGGLIVTALAV